ncbi:hypothetical protein OROGR_007493 [Orobanche gracilis]
MDPPPPREITLHYTMPGCGGAMETEVMVLNNDGFHYVVREIANFVFQIDFDDNIPVRTIGDPETIDGVSLIRFLDDEDEEHQGEDEDGGGFLDDEDEEHQGEDEDGGGFLDDGDNQGLAEDVLDNENEEDGGVILDNGEDGEEDVGVRPSLCLRG